MCLTFAFRGTGGNGLKSRRMCVKAMRDGEPSIGTRAKNEPLVVGVWMMQPGEDKIVARRLREVLQRKA